MSSGDNSEAKETKISRFDVGFFLSNIQKDHCVCSDTLKTGEIINNALEGLRKTSERIPELAEFLEKAKGKPVFIAVGRLEAKAAGDAIVTVWQWLSHIRDLVCITTGVLPSITSICFVREGEAPHAKVHRFGPQASLRIGQPSPEEQTDWEDRCNTALQKML